MTERAPRPYCHGDHERDQGNEDIEHGGIVGGRLRIGMIRVKRGARIMGTAGSDSVAQ